jgi:hypothetical protein
MNNKENMNYTLSKDKNLDKAFTNSTKFNIRTNNISGLANDLDMEK